MFGPATRGEGGKKKRNTTSTYICSVATTGEGPDSPLVARRCPVQHQHLRTAGVLDHTPALRVHLDVLLDQPHELLGRALCDRVDNDLDVRHADQQRADHASNASGFARTPRGDCEEILVGAFPATLSTHLLHQHSVVVAQRLHERRAEHLVVQILLEAEATFRKEQINAALDLLEQFIAFCLLLPIDAVCVELSHQWGERVCSLNVTPPCAILNQVQQACVEVLQWQLYWLRLETAFATHSNRRNHWRYLYWSYGVLAAVSLRYSCMENPWSILIHAMQRTVQYTV